MKGAGQHMLIFPPSKIYSRREDWERSCCVLYGASMCQVRKGVFFSSFPSDIAPKKGGACDITTITRVVCVFLWSRGLIGVGGGFGIAKMRYPFFFFGDNECCLFALDSLCSLISYACSCEEKVGGGGSVVCERESK